MRSISVLVFVLSSTKATDINTIFARLQPQYNDTYEDINAVGMYMVRSTIECTSVCITEKRCLSFFYNTLTKACILHADPFTYAVRTKSGIGWRFYRTIDLSGRCADDYFFYRWLGLCYKFGPKIQATSNHVMQACNGSAGLELIRIDSEDRQKYLKMITADIGLVYDCYMCIQGTNMVDTAQRWTFNDGALMTYFNWKNGEPRTPSSYLRVQRKMDYVWRIGLNTSSEYCSYICEHR